MTFTQPLCNACWARLFPTRRPLRLVGDALCEERCCRCGTMTQSGIYYRVNPASVPYPRSENAT